MKEMGCLARRRLPSRKIGIASGTTAEEEVMELDGKVSTLLDVENMQFS